ncbi:MAG: hypothetical protein KGL39_10850 [Patescibacteria group bacterium]|nr:hypothetical protein [Patescibacteria group bacterium]
MSLTAQQMSKKAARGRDVDAVVQEQLLMIDDKLSHHPVSWGRNVVPYELPTTPPLTNLQKRDAQRVVYSQVIHSLEKRGFEVALELSKEKTMIYIAWVTVFNADELNEMNKTLQRCRISSEDVQGFLKGVKSPGRKDEQKRATPRPGDAKKTAPRPNVPAWAAGATVPPGNAEPAAAAPATTPATV